MKEIVKSYFNTNRVESMIEFLKAMTERTKELYIISKNKRIFKFSRTESYFIFRIRQM